MKKLYRVRVDFTYHVFADSPSHARLYAKDAASDINDNECIHVEDAGGEMHGGEILVYGTKHDTTLDQALAIQGLPTTGDNAAAWLIREGYAP